MASTNTQATATRLAMSRLQSYAVESFIPHGGLHPRSRKPAPEPDPSEQSTYHVRLGSLAPLPVRLCPPRRRSTRPPPPPLARPGRLARDLPLFFGRHRCEAPTFLAFSCIHHSTLRLF